MQELWNFLCWLGRGIGVSVSAFNFGQVHVLPPWNPIFAATASTEWKHQFWEFIRKLAKKQGVEMMDVDPFEVCEEYPKAEIAAEQHKLWIEVYEALQGD